MVVSLLTIMTLEDAVFGAKYFETDTDLIDGNVTDNDDESKTHSWHGDPEHTHSDWTIVVSMENGERHNARHFTFTRFSLLPVLVAAGTFRHSLARPSASQRRRIARVASLLERMKRMRFLLC